MLGLIKRIREDSAKDKDKENLQLVSPQGRDNPQH